MINLRDALNLGRSRGGWQKFLRALDRGHSGSAAKGRLREVFFFGSNPGNLRMFGYRPPTIADNPALVVVLHGCTQTAAGYDLGAGWSTLADRYGFALLLPEQQRSNNPNGCFNWFRPEHSRRNQGEPLSIRQMIEKSVVDHGIDRRRVFVTGLSAGGAMASNMLACYPEVFAGGAIIAGLPYGAARNVQQAFESMFQSPSRSAREWGDLVRKASSHRGPWPRVSVWHGNDDKTVIPSNALEILKQWTEVHGLPLSPSVKTRVDGYPREVWINGAGDELIEAYTITNMAHGTPLAIGEAEGACGAPGPFLLPVGISSSYHIAKFFGIAVARAPAERNASVERNMVKISSASRHYAAAEPVLEGEVLDKDEPISQPEQLPPFPEIGAVINKALRAAGLIRD
ncbi:MAG TPA: PHB depolymerase family esterase [Methylococcaceae bacterium]|nr:PHB depolymerase family esterase [Methylococcaceae bacterium]